MLVVHQASPFHRVILVAETNVINSTFTTLLEHSASRRFSRPIQNGTICDNTSTIQLRGESHDIMFCFVHAVDPIGGFRRNTASVVAL